MIYQFFFLQRLATQEVLGHDSTTSHTHTHTHISIFIYANYDNYFCRVKLMSKGTVVDFYGIRSKFEEFTHPKSGVIRGKLWKTYLRNTIYLEPLCPLFWASTLQNKALSNQNKGHLGSRYIYIYIFAHRKPKINIGPGSQLSTYWAPS